jgi:hypothetical protein
MSFDIAIRGDLIFFPKPDAQDIDLFLITVNLVLILIVQDIIKVILRRFPP